MTDIGFTNVPANQRIPGIYPEVHGDIPSQPPQSTLIIGQTLKSQPAVPVAVSSVANAVKQFGQNSMLASMVERYLANDPGGNLWCLPLTDVVVSTTAGFTAASAAITGLPATGIANGMTIVGQGVPIGAQIASYSSGAGTATLSAGTFTGSTGTISVTIGTYAQATIDFTHTPNEDGTIWIYIAGRSVAIPVTNNMAPADIATNAVAAINKYYDANDLGLKKQQRNFLGVAMPVAAFVVPGHTTRVGLVAYNAGSCGNFIDVQLNYYGTTGQQDIPVGLTVAITAMAGGSVDPDTSVIAGLLADEPYDFIVQPYTTTQALNDFQTMMLDSTGRWAPQRKVYGHVFSAAQFGTDGTAAQTFGVARNDQHMTVWCYENTAPMPPYDVAAAATGAFAAASRVDPARPCQTLGVTGILAPHRTHRFAYNTRQALLGCGLALLDYNPDYTVKLMRAITTYQTDANGTPDISYRDTETLYTLMAVVRQMVGDWGAAFPRAKIVDDGVAFGPGSSFTAGLPDQPIVTLKSGKAVLIASYSRMASGNGQAVWLSNVALFQQNLVLQRNSQDPTRLDALMPITLASGLRVTAMKIDFALQSPT
jgi:phage tail sheath gpL-like